MMLGYFKTKVQQKMMLNRKNLLILASIILIAFLFAYLWNKNKQDKFYKNNYCGVVEEIKANRRFENAKVVKLQNQEDYNHNFWIYAPLKDDLKINDSISKIKNNLNYRIYRKNKLGKFEFYKILRNNSE